MHFPFLTTVKYGVMDIQNVLRFCTVCLLHHVLVKQNMQVKTFKNHRNYPISILFSMPPHAAASFAL